MAIMDSCRSESFRCRWEELTAAFAGDPFWSDSFVIVIAGLPDTGALWRMLQNGHPRERRTVQLPAIPWRAFRNNRISSCVL